jgi:hypothetical protein
MDRPRRKIVKRKRYGIDDNDDNADEVKNVVDVVDDDDDDATDSLRKKQKLMKPFFASLTKRQATAENSILKIEEEKNKKYSWSELILMAKNSDLRKFLNSNAGNILLKLLPTCSALNSDEKMTTFLSPLLDVIKVYNAAENTRKLNKLRHRITVMETVETESKTLCAEFAVSCFPRLKIGRILKVSFQYDCFNDYRNWRKINVRIVIPCKILSLSQGKLFLQNLTQFTYVTSFEPQTKGLFEIQKFSLVPTSNNSWEYQFFHKAGKRYFKIQLVVENLVDTVDLVKDGVLTQVEKNIVGIIQGYYNHIRPCCYWNGDGEEVSMYEYNEYTNAPLHCPIIFN